jgi:hypothetical protein
VRVQMRAVVRAVSCAQGSIGRYQYFCVELCIETIYSLYGLRAPVAGHSDPFHNLLSYTIETRRLFLSAAIGLNGCSLCSPRWQCASTTATFIIFTRCGFQLDDSVASSQQQDDTKLEWNKSTATIYSWKFSKSSRGLADQALRVHGGEG